MRLITLEVNHIVNLEKRITSELKLLKEKDIIEKSTDKTIKPAGSRPGILYRLGKVHEETRNGLPPFRNGTSHLQISKAFTEVFNTFNN